MAIRKHSTGTRTLTAATDSFEFTQVHGKVVCIAIKPSGVATDFRITTTKAGITEYIFGTAAVVSVAAVGVIHYPKVLAQDLDGVDLATTGNLYKDIVLNGDSVTIAVAAGTTSETWVVDMYVEE